MKRALFLLLLLATAGPVGSRPSPAPKLLVLIAVDGLGADVLARAEPALTGGFRRLLQEGRSFPGAVVDHAITVSHPGHVTLATGRHPSGHGIVDAAFYRPEGFTDAVTDPAVEIVGVPTAVGGSPRWIEAPTLAEWAQAASPEARCVAVGTGRWSSLLHAGHARCDVYWYGPGVGRYVTSTAYREDDAPWATAFNSERLPAMLEASRVWELTVPASRRGLARRDRAPYEGDLVHTTFPHRLADLAPPGEVLDARAVWGWFGGTPFADEATLELALAGVRAGALGKRAPVDVLSVVLSTIDDSGHYYGSGSLEQLDVLLRLDRALGRFFDALDREVGRGGWAVALSADHGMLDVPEAVTEGGGNARRFPEEEMRILLAALKAVKPAERAALLRREPFVAEVLRAGEPGGTEPFATLWRHSARPDRVPRFPLLDPEDGTSPAGEAGLLVRLTEGTIPDFDRAVHGSPYLYDRRVPFLLMGPGVRRGKARTAARTVDVAPTLAKLGGIPLPPVLDGKPLL
ncbi:MAG TPA: alkaline phosphatase family protein [Candidatus Polarisedimenticolaceae bacterium]|nr:alkaline phosphatase family protein [Candidatus Polarisedimenticolaceae bacterium]